MPYVFGLRPAGITTHADGATLGYKLAAEADWQTARDYAIANTPLTFSVFYRKDPPRLSHLGAGIWDIDVEYTLSAARLPVSYTYKWTFDTTGQTKHVTYGLAHVATYTAPGRDPIPHYGMIGVADDKVGGVDVPDRAFKWAETWDLPLGNYGFFYGTVLGELTGRVNASYFRGFPAYTVRFEGATGSPSDKDASLVTITFNFAVSPSEAGVIVGDIPAFDKIGWDYASVRCESTDASGPHKTTPKPIQVDIDRLCASFNFSLLGIGAGVLT